MRVSMKWVRELTTQLWSEHRLSVACRAQADENFAGAWQRLARTGCEQPRKRPHLVAAALRFGEMCKTDGWHIQLIDFHTERFADAIELTESTPARLIRLLISLGPAVAAGRDRKINVLAFLHAASDGQRSPDTGIAALAELHWRGLAHFLGPYDRRAYAAFAGELLTDRALAFLNSIGAVPPALSQALNSVVPAPLMAHKPNRKSPVALVGAS